jgi:peptidoglycan/LPS O-acetylase OafA/YrhL
MPKRPESHPENTLTLALVLVGAAVLAAVVLIVISVAREEPSGDLIRYGIGLVLVAGVAAGLILARARRIRRRERPDWLETQAWQQGQQEQIQKGKPERGPDRPER